MKIEIWQLLHFWFNALELLIPLRDQGITLLFRKKTASASNFVPFSFYGTFVCEI